MAQIKLTNQTFYNEGKSGASAVVGWDGYYNRVVRYTLLSDSIGASSVSLTFAKNSLANGTAPSLRFYIGTSKTSHANASPDSEYTGSLTLGSDGKTYTGSASIMLLPNTTYYVFVFPAHRDTYGWMYWSTVSGNAIATTSGAAVSAFSCSNGTLATPLTIAVTRYSDSYTHTITYRCGTASGTIASKSSSTSITWTPPLDLASQNPSDDSVLVTITLQTYNGAAAVGEPISKVVTMAIPESVKPTCSVEVADSLEYASKYSAYVKSLSKLKVTVEASGSQGSKIVSYKITANGSVYTDASFTTEALKASGTQYVIATVKDSRGRTSAEVSAPITVLDYTAPTISALTASRCNADGTVNKVGKYVKVKFSAVVTALNNKNSAKYILKYKKTSAASYTSVSLDALENIYTATNETYIFPADADSAYVVELTLEDNHLTAARTTAASTAAVIMHPHPSGDGLAVLKKAEKEGYFEVGGPACFYKGAEGITHDMVGAAPVKTPARGDLSSVGWYRVGEVKTYNCYRLSLATIYNQEPDMGAIIDIVAPISAPLLNKTVASSSSNTVTAIDQIRLVRSEGRTEHYVDIHYSLATSNNVSVLLDGPDGWFTLYPYEEWVANPTGTAAVTLAL